MRLLNYFNHHFFEERVRDITAAIFNLNTPLSDAIIYYLFFKAWDGYEYRENFELVKDFLKRNKFNLYSDDFDFQRLIDCINNEKDHYNSIIGNNTNSDIIIELN